MGKYRLNSGEFKGLMGNFPPLAFVLTDPWCILRKTNPGNELSYVCYWFDEVYVAVCQEKISGTCTTEDTLFIKNHFIRNLNEECQNILRTYITKRKFLKKLFNLKKFF